MAQETAARPADTAAFDGGAEQGIPFEADLWSPTFDNPEAFGDALVEYLLNDSRSGVVAIEDAEDVAWLVCSTDDGEYACSVTGMDQPVSLEGLAYPVTVLTSGRPTRQTITEEQVARTHYESIFDHPDDVPWAATSESTKRRHRSWAKEFITIASLLQGGGAE